MTLESSDVKAFNNTKMFTFCPDIDGCVSHSCENGATCIDLPNSYRCDCPPGYQGIFCQNGKVHSLFIIYFLLSFYIVLTCDHEGMEFVLVIVGILTYLSSGIMECLSIPCMNGATCVDLINGYRCDCASGFNGINCQTGKCQKNI